MRNPASKTACCSKVGIKRGPWTPEEDKILSDYINKEGEGRWRTLPKRAGLQRCGKSCRLRWMNYLRPSVKRGRIAPDEEDLILRLHRLLGNRWSLIAGRIPGRTDNEIKNYWNTHLSKKLISQGIDPRNHKPLNPSPPNTSLLLSSGVADNNNNPPPSVLSNPNPKNSQALQEASSSHGDGATLIINKGVGNNLRIITNPNNSNPNPSPNKYHQAHQPAVGATIVGEDYGTRNSTVDRGVLMNEDNYFNKCNEVDTFSSFLDTLISESAFITHHHHQQPLPPQLPVVSSANAFDHGTFWEAELIRSAMEDLGDMQNGFNST